jgi:PPM family protein phosphatase
MIRVDVCGRTDVGRTREHNEDAYLIADVGGAAPLPDGRATGYVADGRGLLFMVADGMGGAAAGEIASEMAVGTVLEMLAGRWQDGATVDPTVFASALREAGEEANRRIHSCALEHPEYRGMGTTATIAGLLGDTLYLAQVGDSRAYLVRDGAARQITKDQSLLQRLVEAGEMTAEEAERSERRNIILQALGPEANVVIDLTHQQVRRGDVLILCSDGLSGLVRDEFIAEAVAEAGDMCEVCERLIAAANENGGPDNITVVAARFDGDGLPVASEADAVGHQRFPNSALAVEDDWINGDPALHPLSLDDAPPPAVSAVAPPPRPAAVPVPREGAHVVVQLLRGLVVVTALAVVGYLFWRWLGR